MAYDKIRNKIWSILLKGHNSKLYDIEIANEITEMIINDKELRKDIIVSDFQKELDKQAKNQ